MRDGDIKVARNLAAELDLRQRRGERGILLQRDSVLASRLDDLVRELSAAFGDHARGTAPTVVKRDGQRSVAFAHARTSSSRVGLAPTSPAGMPCRHTTRSIS